VAAGSATSGDLFSSRVIPTVPIPYLFAIMVAPVVLIVVTLTVYCLSQITPLVVALAAALPYVFAGALIVYATGLGWRATLWESGPWEGGEPSPPDAPPSDATP
jgi:hypothetical protein